MRRINVGVIGCGRIAMGKHLPNLHANPHVSVKAFHNRTRSKALRAKERFGDEDAVVHDDPYALIGDEQLDAVHILTANDTHHEFSVAALREGKHVMCEKPMASSYEEAETMVEEKNRSGKTLAVAFQNRHRLDVRMLKTLIDEGTLGTVYHVKARSVRRRGIPTWGAFTQSDQGGGPLIDIGSHALDLALYFIGFQEPRSVSGSKYQKLSDRPTSANRFGRWDADAVDVEDSAFAFMQFKSSLSMSLETSYALNTVHEEENTIELFGTEAGALLNDDGLTLNYVEDDTLVEKTIHKDKGDAGKAETNDFINAILSGKAPSVKAEEALLNMRIIEAIYESSEKKTPVLFSE